MKTLVFDVRGPYALFKKPFTPLSPVSYPFPPPPTVLGLIGAICGYRKDEYHNRIGWERVRIGVGLNAPIKRLRAGINLINTKNNRYFRLAAKDPRIQIPHEFIKNADYRIYVGNGRSDAMSDLETHLRNGTNVYNVSLGLAQCLADVSFVGAIEASPLSEGHHRISSVVPLSQTTEVHYEPGRLYAVFRIPVRMNPNRVVTNYGEVAVEEEGRDLSVVTSNAFDVRGKSVLFF
jgi:CRISPR-associated protein Cas5h